MSFKVLNLYYQYANCISETINFYKKSLILRFFSPEEASNLQLLSISLPDSNDNSNNNSDDFILIKELLNIINSYSAQFSQSDFDSLDFEFIEFILFILTIIIHEILELNYKKLSDEYQQDLIETQIHFILEGIPLFFEENKLNNINKEVILNKLNENESILSNQNYQAILRKALDM
jgi:hypothetical protein